MLFPIKKPEEYIIFILRNKVLSGPQLLKEVQKKFSISKESFYRILRTLLLDEVILKNKTIYSIHSRWLESLSEFINYNDGNTTLSLQDGDQVTYTFKDAKSMYNYWAYMYDTLFKKHPRNTPILLYHSYHWFIYGRKEAETLFFKKFTKEKQLVLLSIGGNSLLEKDFKKDWASKYIQINTGITYGNENTVYINVVGEYIFKVHTSKKFAEDIKKFLHETKIITPQTLDVLKTIIERKDHAKLTIKRSKKESQKWFTKYKKDFVFPKTL